MVYITKFHINKLNFVLQVNPRPALIGLILPSHTATKKVHTFRLAWSRTCHSQTLLDASIFASEREKTDVVI